MPIAAYLNRAGRINAELCSTLPVGHTEVLTADQNATVDTMWINYAWPVRVQGGPVTVRKNQRWQLEVVQAGPPETIVSLTQVG